MGKREEGYYWVKVNKIWCICEYSDSRWWIGGQEESVLDDSYFDEIDERKIVRE